MGPSTGGYVARDDGGSRAPKEHIKIRILVSPVSRALEPEWRRLPSLFLNPSSIMFGYLAPSGIHGPQVLPEGPGTALLRSQAAKTAIQMFPEALALDRLV